MLARDAAAGGKISIGRALGFGAGLSLGATAFVLIVGSLIALGAGALFETVTFTSTSGIWCAPSSERSWSFSDSSSST